VIVEKEARFKTDLGVIVACVVVSIDGSEIEGEGLGSDRMLEVSETSSSLDQHSLKSSLFNSSRSR